MRLHTLLRQYDPALGLEGVPDVDIRGICEDSRRVTGGELFIARIGTKTDGRRFIADAAARGAAAVVSDRAVEGCPIPQVILTATEGTVSRLAHLFHERPCDTVRVLGITGTNGKTTTAYLIRHLLAKAGRKCGMVGTVEVDDGNTRREAEMTTPSAADIPRLLASMRDHGSWACAMEVSSHALDQGRASGLRFAGAAFTNLTRDHLDYHKTMPRYAAAKAKLFDMLDSSAVAVTNVQDRRWKKIVGNTKARVIRFGLGRAGDWRARDIEITATGSKFTLDVYGLRVPVRMALIGQHNIANALTAAALAGEVFQIPAQEIAEALATATGAPGRLQPVSCGQPFGVFVDYAHTDDGLRNVMTALRPLTKGKLRVLFGCGGDRDRSKRPLMGRVVEELADVGYLTSDNPRSENPTAIIDEIIAGLSADVELSGATRKSPPDPKASGGTCKAVVVDPDRRRAIERVLTDAREGDVVLLAGKGHENYQIIGADKRHFDDLEEATRVLNGMRPTLKAG